MHAVHAWAYSLSVQHELSARGAPLYVRGVREGGAVELSGRLLGAWLWGAREVVRACVMVLARARVSLRGHPNFFRIFRTEGTQISHKFR